MCSKRPVWNGLSDCVTKQKVQGRASGGRLMARAGAEQGAAAHPQPMSCLLQERALIGDHHEIHEVSDLGPEDAAHTQGSRAAIVAGHGAKRAHRPVDAGDFFSRSHLSIGLRTSGR